MHSRTCFSAKRLTSNRRTLRKDPACIEDVLLKSEMKSQITTASDDIWTFQTQISQPLNVKPTLLQTWFIEDGEDLYKSVYKDVRIHSSNCFKSKRQFTTQASTTTTRKITIIKQPTLPMPMPVSKPQQKLHNKRKSLTLNTQQIDLPAVKPTAEPEQLEVVQAPFFLNVKQAPLDYQVKHLFIDPMELKNLYDEISKINNVIDKLFEDSEHYVQQLFNDREEQLQVRNNALNCNELKIVMDALIAKHDMIKQNASIEGINFDAVENVIKKLAFFERFTKSTRINLLKLGQYIEVPAGEYVFHQGDFGDKLYVILYGSVLVKVEKQFNRTGAVMEYVQSTLYDGQHFGELSMMETRQKGEEQLLEEKLQNIEITSLKEAQKELFRLDMEALGQESKMLQNMRIRELQKSNSEMLSWMGPENTDQLYVMKLVNDNDIKQPGNKASDIEYKKADPSQTRKASIQTAETCHLMAISREDFKNILMVLMQDELEQKIRMLKSLRFFKDIQPFVLIPLANQLIPQRYRLDEVVIKQNSPLEYMYILYKGSCNVIRTSLTKRVKLPSEYSKGALQKHSKLQKGKVVKAGMFASDNEYLKECADDGELIHKIPDYAVTNSTDTHIEYRRSYIYKRLYPGEILFGRVLTGLTLEGHKGNDTSRMTVVSSSSTTIMYKISIRLLQFCPEFLISHLNTQLMVYREIDEIPHQPLNKQIKQVFNPSDQLSQDQRIMESEQKRKKLEISEMHRRNKTRRTQNEMKQDVRNEQWEHFKDQLVIDQYKYH